MKPFQHELPVIGPVYNLSPECAPDMQRVARDWQKKISRTLADTPGFIGADVPRSPLSPGRVIVEPAMTIQAVRWLRRRFEVAENLEVDAGNGLAIDIRPRNRRAGVKRHKFTGCRVEQFQFGF